LIPLPYFIFQYLYPWYHFHISSSKYLYPWYHFHITLLYLISSAKYLYPWYHFHWNVLNYLCQIPVPLNCTVLAPLLFCFVTVLYPLFYYFATVALFVSFFLFLFSILFTNSFNLFLSSRSPVHCPFIIWTLFTWSVLCSLSLILSVLFL
jgi:hypothetical protein